MEHYYIRHDNGKGNVTFSRVLAVHGDVFSVEDEAGWVGTTAIETKPGVVLWAVTRTWRDPAGLVESGSVKCFAAVIIQAGLNAIYGRERR